MANMLESQSKATVELVEISEQLEPLMPRKSPPAQQKHANDDNFDASSTGTSQNATPVPPSPSAHSGSEYLPLTHAGDVTVAGGAAQNRKRPVSKRDSQYITMTGTVKTGNSAGQPVEVCTACLSVICIGCPDFMHCKVELNEALAPY